MTMLLVTMAMGLGAPAVPVASEVRPHTACSNEHLLTTYSGLWHAVRRQYRHTDKDAMGRNIRRWGLRNGSPARCRHVAKSIRTLRVLRMPAGARHLTYSGAPPQPPSGAGTVHPGGLLARIAQCESNGNATVVNSSGHAGLYQFDQQTWESVGGTGSPAAASEGEQHKRAAILMAQRGTQPWSASRGCWGR